MTIKPILLDTVLGGACTECFGSVSCLSFSWLCSVTITVGCGTGVGLESFDSLGELSGRAVALDCAVGVFFQGGVHLVQVLGLVLCIILHPCCICNTNVSQADVPLLGSYNCW